MKSVTIILLLLGAHEALSQMAEAGTGAMCAAQRTGTSIQRVEGTINLKILLVQFPDVPCRKDSDGHSPRYSSGDFENLLGSNGIYVSPGMHSPDGDDLFGSLNDYYEKMSGGTVRINAFVINRLDSLRDRPIWITLGRPKQYYQQCDMANTPIFTDALQSAQESGLDVSTSDNTKLAIVYAGNTYFQRRGLNPMAVGWCYIMSEVQGRPYNQELADAHFSRIGIHCHEFGHTVGIGHSTGGRADVMYGGTANGSVEGNAPAPFNAIVRMRKGWANIVPVISMSADSVDISYSLTNPTIYIMSSGDQFLVENRRFNQTMTIGGTTVPDYNNVAFFPPAGPHGQITQGIFVWRLNSRGDVLDPGYSSEGLIYASGRYGRTYPENSPSDTDDGVPFPGVSNNRLLSPWSDPRGPYLKEADYFNSGVYHYNLFVPNTKGGYICGMEILSENRAQGTFRVRFSTSTPPNPGLLRQPNVGSLGAYDSRRTVCRDDSGVLHQILEVGGEIFYHRSTDGGSSWEMTSMLSNGNGGNSAPCLTMAGPIVLVVWQVQASGKDIYVLHCTRSADYGRSWADLNSVGWSYGCSAPGPYPSVAGSRDGSAILVYRADGSSLVSTVSHDAGIIWSSPVTVPSGNIVWNTPSLLINTSLTGASEGTFAYCSDSLQGPPQVRYDDFTIGAGAWGSSRSISGILPSQYVDFRHPNLAPLAGQGSPGPLNIIWDASDSYAGGRPAIISRTAGLQSPCSSFRVLKGESQNDLSIAEFTERVLGKGSKGYARVLNLVDTASGAALSIEIGLIQLLHKGGRIDSIQLSDAPSDSVLLDGPALLEAGLSRSFTPGADDDTLQLVASMYGSDSGRLFSSSDGVVGFQIVRARSDIVVATFGRQTVASMATGRRRLTLMSVPVSTLPRQVSDQALAIRPFVRGLRGDAVITASLGHVYSTVREEPVERFITGVGEAMSDAAVAQAFELEQNYPNPFNPATSIRYGMPHRSHVTLTVFNALGQQVAQLVNGDMEAGYHEVTFDGSGQSSGVYFYRLQAGDFTSTKKSLLLK